ncbi:MAG: hypothetical protein OEX19_01920, partial [Gammaproteobacteria bacterium]|nr:hypothetical protein [Gammaproteobacteria bacterium]
MRILTGFKIALLPIILGLTGCFGSSDSPKDDKNEGTRDFTIGGAVSGLAGAGLVLQNNDEDLPISVDGEFLFSKRLSNRDTYFVRVQTQPTSPDQKCRVENGMGLIGEKNVSDIEVSCRDLHSISGSVAGLVGTGLVLHLKDEKLHIQENGNFSFETRVAEGEWFSIFASRPASPQQICTVDKNEGVMGSTDISDMRVNCEAAFYVGGNVAGMTGSGLKLKLNGNDEMVIDADGAFNFARGVANENRYRVSVSASPEGQTCSVVGGDGVIAAADVAGVDVFCATSAYLSATTTLPKRVDLNWTDVGATSYDLHYTTKRDCSYLHIASCPDSVVLTGATSPQSISGLRNGEMYYFKLVAHYPGGHDQPSVETGAKPDVISVDGSVSDITTDSNGKTYIGGGFNNAGARSGSLVSLSMQNGSLGKNAPFVAGAVYASAPDGKGGIYIGGDFSSVGEVSTENLAHIDAKGKVDPNFTFQMSGMVTAMDFENGSLYIAGKFQIINGETREVVAQVYENGQLSPWIAEYMYISRSVWDFHTVEVFNGKVYVGGDFLVGPSSKSGYFYDLIAVDAGSGEVLDWRPKTTTTGAVYDIIGGRDSLYVAGNVGQNWEVVAFDFNGELRSDFVPSVNSASALAYHDDVLYVGGNFTTVNGQSRTRLAAFDAKGNLTSWAPVVDGQVSTITAFEDRIVIGGMFNTVDAVTTPGGLAVIGTDGGLRTLPSIRMAGQKVKTLLYDGRDLYVGGSGRLEAYPTARSMLLSLNSDGTLSTWAPSVDRQVLTLEHDGTTLYVGGEFYAVEGVTRYYAVAFDANGVLTSWNPSISWGSGNHVKAILLHGGKVFLGGQFTYVGGIYSTHMGVVSAV